MRASDRNDSVLWQHDGRIAERDFCLNGSASLPKVSTRSGLRAGHLGVKRPFRSSRFLRQSKWQFGGHDPAFEFALSGYR